MIISNYNAHTDEQLLVLLQEGKEGAFNEIYRRYGKRMYGFFYQLLGNDPPLLHDMCQELFMILIEKKRSFNSEKKFEPWFFTIARNMCKNEYRRKERLEKNQSAWKQENTEAPDITFAQKRSGNFDNDLFRKQLSISLQQLDFLARTCFILRYQEELPIKDIAEIVDCPVGTVKSRLFYTLKKLATQLEIFRSPSN